MVVEKLAQKHLEVYHTLADSMGLTVCGTMPVISGNLDGLDVSFHATDSRDPYIFQMTVFATPGTYMDNKALKKALKPTKHVVQVTQQDKKLILSLRLFRRKTVVYDFPTTVKQIIFILKSLGFQSSCSICNNTENTELYLLGSDNLMSLCPECGNRTKENIAMINSKQELSGENVIAGIIGAFLGGCIGVIFIVIIGLLGYVAAAGGVIMAVCTLKGYELFAKKMSKKGIFFCILMMIFMIFVAFSVDTGLLIFAEFADYGVSPFTCIAMVPELFLEDLLDTRDLLPDLLQLYAFSGLGIFLMLRHFISESKKKARILYLGGRTTSNYTM